MPGDDDRRAGTKSPAALEANRPVAAALMLARVRFTDLDQREFQAELRSRGCPVNRDSVPRWERGADQHASPDQVRIVPGYVLLYAARVVGRSVGELLAMAGVEGQTPLADQLAELRRRVAALEDKLGHHAMLTGHDQDLEHIEAADEDTRGALIRSLADLQRQRREREEG